MLRRDVGDVISKKTFSQQNKTSLSLDGVKEETERFSEQTKNHRTLWRQKENTIGKILLTHDIYCETHTKGLMVTVEKSKTDTHADTAKAESLLATKCLRKKWSLLAPYPALACDCGWHSQTAKDIIRHSSIGHTLTDGRGRRHHGLENISGYF